MSVGLETRSITEVLNRLSKIPLPDRLAARIRDWTSSYGKIRLVLKHNRYFLESSVPEFLRILLNDEVIAPCRVIRENEQGQEVFGMDMGAERGVAARRDFHIPGTEQARRAEQGVMEPVQDRSGVRDDVIAAVIGIDQSEYVKGPVRWVSLTFFSRRNGRGRRGTFVRTSSGKDGRGPTKM